MKLISVVIPCYNEKERIFPVVDAILKSAQVREVIVVDDGSLLETAKILKKLPSEVIVLTHKKNKGKAETLKTGLKVAKGEVVVFVDADLTGFTKNHLEALARPVINYGCEMSLGLREHDVWYAKLISFDAAYGGERAFNRKTLLKNIDIFDSGGYLIEADFNNRFLSNRKVSKFLMKGVGQTAKFQKVGITGLYKSVQMLLSIVRHLGWKEFWSQILTINRLKFSNES